MADDAKKTSVLNVEDNIAAAVCYIPILGVLPAIAFLVLEKNDVVRWNAVQAITLWVVVVIADALLDISIVGHRLITLVNLVGMVVIPLALAVKANQKEPTRLPVLGEVADRLLKIKK